MSWNLNELVYFYFLNLSTWIFSVLVLSRALSREQKYNADLYVRFVQYIERDKIRKGKNDN